MNDQVLDVFDIGTACATAHMKPANSRATATTTTLGDLPRWVIVL
jgi:hypothetical protein